MTDDNAESARSTEKIVFMLKNKHLETFISVHIKRKAY